MSNNQYKQERKQSIELNICNMLEKLLDDSVEEEKDEVTALNTNPSSSVTFTSMGDDYQRKEKKTHSLKETKTFNFNSPRLGGTYDTHVQCNPGNYEEMYSYHRSVMHKQKKFKTALIIDPHIISSKFNTICGNNNYGSGMGAQFNLLGRGDVQLENPAKNPPLLNVINCKNNLFTFNDNELTEIHLKENCLTEKTIQITTELYMMLKGNFSKVIRTQNGSRILQNCLALTDESIISQICKEILPNFHNIIIDCYGNYFCPKFYACVSFKEKLMILNHLVSHIAQVSNNPVGTYPMQSIIEQYTTDEEKLIICEAIANEITFNEICSDQQGVHVIEKIIVYFSEGLIPFIYEFVLQNFVPLATSSTGLVIVKKVILHHSKPLTLRRLQNLFISNFHTLIQDIYGNHTIQIALEVN
jgi:hypothetical protein